MRVARGFWAMWALSLELAMGNGQWESVVGRVGQRTPLLWTLVTDHAKTSDAIMTVTALHGQTRSTSTSAFNASKATTSQKGKKRKTNGNKFPSPKLRYMFSPGRLAVGMGAAL